MRVEQLGSGEPEVAVVGGIHGDEPCGVGAVRALAGEAPPVERPVKLVVANERAVERGERYVDADLNRSFPGDATAPEHERRLAAEVAAELDGCTVLALHSTQSHAAPFAVVDGLGETAERLPPRLPVEAVVDTASFVDGRLFAADAEVVEVECGRQGSPAARATAERVARAFLAATGALPHEDSRRSVPAFRLVRKIPKEPAEGYEVLAENFQRVAEGEPFARAGGRELVAEAPFYPVLVSANGYDAVFGYAADRVGAVG
jgi:succinylglutamate desuccinylase